MYVPAAICSPTVALRRLITSLSAGPGKLELGVIGFSGIGASRILLIRFLLRSRACDLVTWSGMWMLSVIGQSACATLAIRVVSDLIRLSGDRIWVEISGIFGQVCVRVG